MRFVGRVKDGANLFNQLKLPGAGEGCGLIRDWPGEVHKGSLNVRIDADGYPERFVAEFDGRKISSFDSRRFLPAAELESDIISNNTLSPTQALPDRGRLQIWRAFLKKVGSGRQVQCWLLRRRRSTMREDTIELVAGIGLRDALSLENDDKVEVLIEGTWVPTERV